MEIQSHLEEKDKSLLNWPGFENVEFEDNLLMENDAIPTRPIYILNEAQKAVHR